MNNWLKNNCWLVVLALVLVVYMILLGMCLCQMHQSASLLSRNLDTLPQPIPSKVYITMEASSVMDSAMTKKMDSVIRIMKEWNEYCDANLLHGLDDLRQETNNVINKQNGWLSFWLAILALIGGLLPFAIQMKVQKDQKQIMKMHASRWGSHFRQLRDDMKMEYETQKQRIQEFAENVSYAEISKLSFTLITCYEDRWSENDIDRERFENEMFDKLGKEIGIFFKDVDLQKVDYLSLKMVLLQLHAVVSSKIPTCEKKHKLRKLTVLNYDIGDLISQLDNKNPMNDLKNKLEDISSRMKELEF